MILRILFYPSDNQFLKQRLKFWVDLRSPIRPATWGAGTCHQSEAKADGFQHRQPGACYAALKAHAGCLSAVGGPSLGATLSAFWRLGACRQAAVLRTFEATLNHSSTAYLACARDDGSARYVSCFVRHGLAPCYRLVRADAHNFPRTVAARRVDCSSLSVYAGTCNSSR